MCGKTGGWSKAQAIGPGVNLENIPEGTAILHNGKRVATLDSCGPGTLNVVEKIGDDLQPVILTGYDSGEGSFSGQLYLGSVINLNSDVIEYISRVARGAGL